MFVLICFEFSEITLKTNYSWWRLLLAKTLTFFKSLHENEQVESFSFISIIFDARYQAAINQVLHVYKKLQNKQKEITFWILLNLWQFKKIESQFCLWLQPSNSWLQIFREFYHVKDSERLGIFLLFFFFCSYLIAVLKRWKNSQVIQSLKSLKKLPMTQSGQSCPRVQLLRALRKPGYALNTPLAHLWQSLLLCFDAQEVEKCPEIIKWEKFICFNKFLW